MLNKIISKKLTTAECSNLKIDRILIFVDSISEIEAFRALHFYYFEFAMCNLEQGTVSSIFFLKDVNFELVCLEDRQFAFRHVGQNNLDFSSLVQQRRQNRAVPFAFILSYSAPEKPQSKRRCYHTNKHEIDHTQAATQINFSLKNLYNLQEPACYIVPESLTSESLLDSSSVIKQKLLAHQSKTSRLTDIQITLNSSDSLSQAMSLISSLEFVKMKQGELPKLELISSNSNKKQFSLTAFSSIPIIFHY
jgi:hypothetical protein